MEGEGGAKSKGVRLPSLPPLYIGALGGAGQGVASSQAKWGAPPPLGFPNPRRMGGGPGGGAQPTRGWFPSTFSPWGPPG